MRPTTYNHQRGKYIIIEGIDGSGKTTQRDILLEKLQAAGIEAKSVREPAGDAVGRAVRKILLDPQYEMSARTEVLLFNAARSGLMEHINHTLEQGIWVVADRSYLATIAYQGYGRQEHLSVNTIKQICDFTVDGTPADLVIILDGPPQAFIQRKADRGTSDRLDNLDISFYERARQGYLAEAASRKFPIIDATARQEIVAEAIWSYVETLQTATPQENSIMHYPLGQIVTSSDKTAGLSPIAKSQMGYPAIHASVFHTAAGTAYLRQPGVVITAAPRTDISGLRTFLEGFAPELNFPAYLDDPTPLPDATALIKTAGQACYASYGPKRTLNDHADRYIDNILSSGHGSVLEHSNYSLFIYGISRSLTHELIRHRAGMAYSQLSQRYVSGKVLRFVERPEYAADAQLHAEFETDIDHAAKRYADTTERLLELQTKGSQIMSADQKTDLRKKVQQAARSKLPNDTETFAMVTGNVRAWRHIINMRANEHAETEIRQLAVNIYRVLSDLDPMLFADMELVPHHDGTYVVKAKYPKP